MADSLLKILKIHLIKWHATITSGHYKNRKPQKANESTEGRTIDWVDHTDEEKLNNAFATMEAHCKNLFNYSEEIKGVK